MNIYKTFEELKEELGDKYDKFMYDMNLELVKQKEKEQQELDKYKNIVDELEKYLENNKVNIGIKSYSKYAIPVEDISNKLKELKGE